MDGILVFNPEGKRIGAISLPERSANICFGGVKRNRLFMAASHSLYSLYVGAQGCRRVSLRADFDRVEPHTGVVAGLVRRPER